MDLTRNQRLEQLQTIITTREPLLKQESREWTAAVMWDVRHERKHRTMPNKENTCTIVFPFVGMIVFMFVASINQSTWGMMGLVVGVLACAIIANLEAWANKVTHRVYEPAHYLPDRSTLPDLLAAVEGPLWTEWVDAFRSSMVKDMDERVVFAYKAEVVHATFVHFMNDKMDAFARNN